MKRLVLFFLILTVFSCTESPEEEFELIDHIPGNAELILITPDVDLLLTEIDKNQFLKTSNFPLKKKLVKQLAFLKELSFNNETAIAFTDLSSKNFSYTLITERDSSLVQYDSIRNKKVETIKEKDLEFQHVSMRSGDFFILEKGNAVVISNSKQRLAEISSRKNLLADENFKKAFNASDRNKNSLLLNHELTNLGLNEFFQKLNFPGFLNFANWSVLDLDISTAEIKTNGISLSKTSDDILKIISQTNPQPSETAKICPDDFLSFYSITYSKFENLKTGLNAGTKDSISANYPRVLDHSREISIIKLKDGDALVLNINEIEAGKEALAGRGEEIENYRGTKVYQLNELLAFKEKFSKLIDVENGEFYIILDHFIVFSSQVDALKQIINTFQNADTLHDKAYYNELTTSLSSESSMLFVVNLPSFLKSQHNNSRDSNLKFKKNSLAAFQVISEGDFAHLHGIFSNSEKAAQSNGAEQVASFKLDAPLTTIPAFFKNHRTDQMDIAVQDESNVLHLISNKGNIFWKRNLDSQITSPIYQVDLFKNGNQQLAFSTGYNFEVLDRNGNKVKGYPIKFNQPLTQPLAVFDYDNNRNYRFVLTQNKKVYMVGLKGKAIKGFDFENADSKITKAPKHIRLGSKDYILIAEESGKLNILSRQGKIRVPVSEKFDFSENEWYGHQDNFVSTSTTNNLIKLSQTGKVNYTDLGLAENNRIIADRDNLVYLNENQLSINSKIIDLDFGLYTDPQLFKIKNRSLIAITDTQAQKVYVFNKNAELMEGFPVYGTSGVDISNADLDSKLELIVKGEENEILMYEF